MVLGHHLFSLELFHSATQVAVELGESQAVVRVKGKAYSETVVLALGEESKSFYVLHLDVVCVGLHFYTHIHQLGVLQAAFHPEFQY